MMFCRGDKISRKAQGTSDQPGAQRPLEKLAVRHFAALLFCHFAAAVVTMNVVNPNDHTPRDYLGLDFFRLLRLLDNDPDFHGSVEFGRNGRGVLSDHAAQRLGQSLLRATHHSRFRRIKICTYYMTGDAHQYSALLEFFATGPTRNVMLVLYKGRTHANEQILTAMKANPQPGNLRIVGMSRLKMQTLQLALQGPQGVAFDQCRMCRTESQQVLVNDTTNRDDHDAASAAALVVRNSPERGSYINLLNNKDSYGILKAATTLKTNVTSLVIDFNDPISRQFDYSSLISFVTAQPNGILLHLYFNEKSSRYDRARGLLLAVLVHEFAEKCPDVHSLRVLFRDPLAFPERYIPLLIEALPDSALTGFEFRRAIGTPESGNLLSRDQEQQIAAITQRNSAIPVYLQTTHLLKPRRPPAVNEPIDPPIMLYANDGVDRPKHQFVLSHALSQAAVHPIFFPHFYEYVRNHVGELFGEPGHMRGRTEDAFFVAGNDDDDDKQGAL
jgi:cell division septation protein DedD